MLIVWDSSNPPSDNHGLVYTWNGYNENDSIHSLLKVIDGNDDLFRNIYLRWVYDLGQFRISSKSIIDHLTFQDGFSYWWMTLFVEKSPWNQPAIIDALKLMALEKVILDEKPDLVRFVSDKRNLHESVRALCRNLGVAYEWQRTANSREKLNSKTLYYRLPLFFRSCISMVMYLKERWKLKKSGKQELFNENAIFFGSYFFNLDKQKLDKGVFGSRYWGDMVELIQKNGFKGNWLHLYYPHSEVPNATAAVDRISAFNTCENDKNVHILLERNLSYKSIRFVINGYLLLLKKVWKMKGVKNAFLVKHSAVDLWPLMRKDWKEALLGPVVIHNLFFIELFDKLLAGCHLQKKGVFLYENQSWEKAFIHSWRKYGHGVLIAVPHSTVRYWDLRYFADPEMVAGNAANSMPQADYVAVNGKVAKESYSSNGFPPEKILECEAIRYTALNKVIATVEGNSKRISKSKRILLLGDYMPDGTNSLLTMVAEAFEHSALDIQFVIKPHPNYIIDPDKIPIKGLTVCLDPIEKIILDFDLVISGNTTSAAVDAYVAGVPVVVLIDQTELNFSPLRGQPGVYFVNNSDQLRNGFIMDLFREAGISKAKDFFYLDPDLPKWRQILSN
jgi:surface carbohydrate biosynthesis protein (TIGR04326 family)